MILHLKKPDISEIGRQNCVEDGSLLSVLLKGRQGPRPYPLCLHVLPVEFVRESVRRKVLLHGLVA